MRLLPALVATTLLVLTGCSDDGDGDAADAPTPQPTATRPPALEGDPCDSEVTATGAVEAGWRGQAVVAPSAHTGTPSTYQAGDGAHLLTVSSEKSISFYGDGVLYDDVATDDGNPDTLDVDEDGSGATIEVALHAADGGNDTVLVTATFTC